MDKKFIEDLFEKHNHAESIPPTSQVTDFASRVIQCLFPALSEKKYTDLAAFEIALKSTSDELYVLLTPMQSMLHKEVRELVKSFTNEIPEMYRKLQTDIEAIVAGDPAAQSEYEVVRTYLGFYAIAMYRLAHVLYHLKIPVIPRLITEYAHSRTGIDIHPGAQIQPYFFIDHGTGIVIGETAVIGKNVKLYQGVTLGALSVSKTMASTKRHPTIEDNVVIYAGATILGGETVIGHHSIVGGNVWLTKSIPAYSTAYHRPQIELSQSGNL